MDQKTDSEAASDKTKSPTLRKPGKFSAPTASDKATTAQKGLNTSQTDGITPPTIAIARGFLYQHDREQQQHSTGSDTQSHHDEFTKTVEHMDSAIGESESRLNAHEKWLEGFRKVN
ncbi:hypothetical protein B0T21DRAFT_411248 [Apiosordaria backusii]|uniref:Uncharacterized protein n=1 Tax=Apiosordaria backusii TaxID=314023 RepID=A0AA40EC45_9PEZI|nr:hypothetical protein B0T21DRAFT_411248 [Apiosordaria backusii]